jgi:hypothetical protein
MEQSCIARKSRKLGKIKNCSSSQRQNVHHIFTDKYTDYTNIPLNILISCFHSGSHSYGHRPISKW